ncbi:MAG: hypothetical protein BGO51_08090 [Rhodospirillales bacterium 69-11]|nr:antitoxin VbhA family protein [Rhodospirillales bacterium]MBN8910031.1 antitoxin VbhA family protein [Rhodospirillales bacterium]MBN8925034.1 antitoxin VbhA family protein [Rhodospirillales bacterium]OJW20400.1 MAG: hypothetical protein BGO51_08090 [Rhodospirillales bacterium 69-11]
MTTQTPPADADKLRAKPPISPAEIERRRKQVEAAKAEERLEGIQPSPVADEIFAAYIRGEIKAEDLVEVCKKAMRET